MPNARPGTHYKSDLAKLKKEAETIPFRITLRSPSYYALGEGYTPRKASTAAAYNESGKRPYRKKSRSNQ